MVIKVMKPTSSAVHPPHRNTKAPSAKVISSTPLPAIVLWLQTLVVIIFSSKILC